MRRRGIALLVILGMLAITMAVSYSLIRTQTQAILLQNNFRVGESAREAALAGMAQAIRKMHVDNAWEGTGSTLEGAFDAQSTYSVSFTPGDASLTVGDANYAEYPFRVTVVSTGTSWNNDDNTLPTTYAVTVVLQLVRRALDTSSTPGNWGTLNSYTCYQWNSSTGPGNIPIDFPIQFQGNVCFLGTLKLAKEYPFHDASREQYLRDLKKKRDESGVDYRPFTGSVTLGSGSGRQLLSTSNELTDWLGTSVLSLAPPGGDPITYVNAPTTYRLYAGGPTYAVPNLSALYGTQPCGQTIAPDVATNPLGIYKAGNSITLKSTTKISGVLFSDGSSDVVQFDGSGVEISGVNLPPLAGSSQQYQLPAAIIKNDLYLQDNAVAKGRGLFMVWNELIFPPSSPQATTLDLQGRVLADNLDLHGRNEFKLLNTSVWIAEKAAFVLQNAVKYYPDWMETQRGLIAQPKITFQPQAGVSYHWPNWNAPIYTKAAGDSGLRWNIISWRERE